MDRQRFWLTLLFVAILGSWLWNRATAVLHGPVTPLLNFAAGVAVAGLAVLLARHVAKLNDGGRGGRK
jgi:hypothetical protein